MKNRKIQQHTSILWLLFGVFMCAVISTSAADEVKMGEVPKEVYDVIDEYLKDTTSSYSFNKRRDFCNVDPSVKFSDIRAGKPIRKYLLYADSILNATENSSIKELIVPVDEWLVPILAYGKGLFIIGIYRSRNTGNLQIGSIKATFPERWRKFKEAWKDYSGLNPVLIIHGNHQFIHFPEIDDYNMLDFNPEYKGDSGVMRSPKTYSKLTDIKTILPYLKKEVIQYREWKKKRNNDKNEEE